MERTNGCSDARFVKTGEFFTIELRSDPECDRTYCTFWGVLYSTGPPVSTSLLVNPFSVAVESLGVVI